MFDVAFGDLPTSAAWQHHHAREGFESVFLTSDGGGYRLEGHTAAVEGDAAWVVHYVISVDHSWCTRSARIEGWSRAGHRDLLLEADGAGRWRVDGRAARELDGCLDVDLESSACTNALPVHRLRLDVGQDAEAPAAYVRALDLRVERLEQHYVRIDDAGHTTQYDYRAPAFEFETRLVYDQAGLVLDYPGIARRVL